VSRLLGIGVALGLLASFFHTALRFLWWSNLVNPVCLAWFPFQLGAPLIKRRGWRCFRTHLEKLESREYQSGEHGL